MSQSTALFYSQSNKQGHSIQNFPKVIRPSTLAVQNKNITDRWLFSIIQKNSNVRWLDLSYCTLITEKTLQVLANIPAIKRINLNGCKQFRDEHIVQIFKNRSDLDYLILPDGKIEKPFAPLVHGCEIDLIKIACIKEKQIIPPKLQHGSFYSKNLFPRLKNHPRPKNRNLRRRIKD